MKNSIQMRIAVAGVISIVIIAAATIGTSIFFFKSEVEQLYRQDFQSRIRGIEYEYTDIDALGAASEEVNRLQTELLDQLSRRFEQNEGIQPFIINGSLELILWPEALEIDKEYASEILDQADQSDTIDTVINTNAGEYWFIANYYEPWDWYTGYAVAESERFGILNKFFVVIFLVTAAIALMAIFSYYLIIRNSLQPLRSIDSAIGLYTEGDLRTRISVKREDEVGRIANGVNQFAERLSAIVSSIKNSSELNVTIEKQLSESSQTAGEKMEKITADSDVITEQVGQLNQLTEQSHSSIERIGSEIAKLTDRIQEQASAVNQSTASIEEMNSSLENVAAITQSKQTSSTKLIQTAHEGGERLDKTNQAIQLMLSRVDSISEFVSVIQNIAGQTNLLAMNAAIEAAHAGESGRGFAVVADEIRKLAEQSGSQSKQISGGIKEIVETINVAASSGDKTRLAFQEIEQEIQTVVNSFEEISSNTSELTIGSGEVMNAMQILQEISNDVQTGAESVKSETSTVESAVKQLAELSARVHELTSAITQQAGSASEVISQVSVASENLEEASRSLNAQVDIFSIDNETTDLEDEQGDPE
ncbi:MAG: HAMP domain-containing protein [Spirochaetaceae bacterium]|nr:HAMP domain-containing protein [Spirochaetaceae bacterium]MCF7947420.1 HAMP domain-containing protein [Spirochaetia bacterium]MCF7951503.1 HAMP domain-containing protein [Spirochaetaceae bacterium]